MDVVGVLPHNNVCQDPKQVLSIPLVLERIGSLEFALLVNNSQIVDLV